MSFTVNKHDAQGVFYTVDWPRTLELMHFIKTTDVFQLMFRTVRSNYAGLGIRLNNGEYDIMWVNSDVWFNKKNYTEYVRDMYEVICLAFKEESEAIECAETMNKDLMWRILNGSHLITV